MGEVTNQIAIVFGVLVACFAGPAAALFVLIRRKAKARQNRRSPIGIALLRGPGHSLREQLDEAQNDLTWDLVLLLVVPLLALALFLAQSHLHGLSRTAHLAPVYALAAIAFIAYLLRKLLKAGSRCRRQPVGSASILLASYGHLPYIQIRETTMANQDTPDTTRDARLEARVSAAQKSLLQQAAALSGRTLSEFVVASAQDAARRVIAEHESICLSREEQLAFVQALLNPPEPNARLKRAAKAYRQRTGA